MKKTIMLTVMLMVLIGPCIALAGDMGVDAYKDKFFKIVTGTPDTVSYKPTWNGTAWVWNTATVYTSGLPPANTVIPVNGYLVLAMENIRVQSNVKYLNVRIAFTGTATLHTDTVGNGYPGGSGTGLRLIETSAGGVYELLYSIRPQPDWEWVLIKNTGAQPATVSAVVWDSRCRSVPSLTTWGLLALVLIMAGTAIWVVRRKRTAVLA